jgi:hypothetical protein
MCCLERDIARLREWCYRNVGQGYNHDQQGKTEVTQGKPCHSLTSSTKYITRNHLGLNPKLHRTKAAPNRPRHANPIQFITHKCPSI